VRKLKGVAVHEPEDRAQRNDESSHSRKRSFSDSPAQSPKKRQPSKHCPPDENGENDGKRAGDALAQQGAQKQDQRNSKPLPFARRLALLQILKPQVSENAPKEKRSGKGVLDLGDPGDRF